ncbi:unnamed protein product [Adineta ricciae]|uniref:Uncharacterized protein n=1 Tax=Adineta ricciae TaxID=249248 RepID=A0A815JSU1_ADIRI|nr:unnamed protein product [Adineta ricciae]
MPEPLFDACEKNKPDRVKVLIAENCDILQVDGQGRSALHYCSENKDTSCARLLLENDEVKSRILDLQDHEGCSALHLACMNGNESMVEFLCERGANVKLVDNESHSLIHWVTVCGHLHLFDILLEYKAPIHTADIHRAFPIHYASQLCGKSVHDDLKIDSAKALEILQIFIDRKVDIDCTDGQNRTPLMWAASADACDALRLLYKYGANQLHVDKDSLTALHCAATRGHTSCIRMLVEQCGCPIEGEDVNGCTALFYAITLDHPKACKLLLDLKANCDHQDNRGRTPSHCAVSKGNLVCLKHLLEAHANIWIKNKRGDYPIHEAINLLVTNKARKATDESTKIYEIIRYIFKLYPYKIAVQNDERRTPLHLAASLGDIDTCEVLIQCGANSNTFIRTNAGNYLTPYDLARVRGHQACADYLVSKYAGQRGNLLASIYARRIQKCYRQYELQKKLSVPNQESSPSKTTDGSSEEIMKTKILPTKLPKSKNTLLKQAKLCLDNKQLDDRFKTHSLNIQSLRKSSVLLDDNNAEERRRVFAKSKTTVSSMNQSNEAKSAEFILKCFINRIFLSDRLDLSNKVIIHASNSIATSNRLYDRRKLIAEELHKLKQARLNNQYIVISRPLYQMLIENAFNPQNRRADEIERYLETLLKAYDVELEAIRKRTKSVPPKLTRRASQLS